MEMKQMIYGKRKKIPEILYGGIYKNHKFAILNLGTHPTAYVEDKIGIKSYYDFRISGVKAHGGITFCDTGHWGKESEKISWLGWDYAHFDDFMGYFLDKSFSGTKKRTTAEIYEEVKSVIDQIIEAEQYAKTKEAQYIQAMLEDCKHAYYDYSQAKEICRILYQKGYRRTEKEIEEDRKDD